jgi:dihydrofolate reductase
MSRVTVFESVTLDGVMQGPGRADEDTRGGFKHGGWAVPYGDEEMGRAAAETMATTDAILMGRRTYEDVLAYWNTQTDNPYTAVLNTTLKLVASRSANTSLRWPNSDLLAGDAAGAVVQLRERPGRDLVVIGSGELARSLIARELVDRYTLLIHPLVLGSGRRLFGDDGTFAALRLIDTRTTTTGVIIATYQPGEQRRAP